jgi:peptidoglycan/xylan/chitin deacetylase (PgdA/CDA1 family)
VAFLPNASPSAWASAIPGSTVRYLNNHVELLSAACTSAKSSNAKMAQTQYFSINGAHVETRGRNPRPGEVLNLCFHGIGTPGRQLEPGEDSCWVETGQFEELLKTIAKYSWVAITFDDGNKSDVAIAMPHLLRLNLNATFFPLAARLGHPGSLASEDVRSLVRAGMTVGSHGMRHRSWPSVSDQELKEELADAAVAIADAAGEPVTDVACPFGSYDRRVLSAVRRHGFSRVYTVDGGAARRDAWLQSRYSVRSSDTPEDIERNAQSPRGDMLPATIRKAKSAVKRWR